MKLRRSSIRMYARTASYAALDLGLVFLVYIASQLTVTTILRMGGVQSTNDLPARPGLLALAYIIGGLVSLGAVVAIIKYQKITIKQLLLQRPKLKDIGYGILGFGAYFLIVRVFVAIVAAIFPSFKIDESQALGFDAVSFGLLPFVFIGLVVMPPISEELLFRGYLRSKFISYKLPMVFNALVVSIVFGALHGQWNVALDTFVLSLVMYYVLSIRESLWTTITMHFIKNTLAFLALFIFKIV